MSYHRGTFNTGKPSTGSHGTRVLRKAFLNLSKAVQQSADNAVKATIASQNTFEMSFDETEAIPATVPASGTILLVGTSDMTDADLYALTSQLANQSLSAVQAELSRSMKEAGYD